MFQNSYQVNVGIPNGRVRRAVPMSIRVAVKIMEALNPFVSKNHKTGTTGIMYMMFPQFPNKGAIHILRKQILRNFLSPFLTK